MEAAFDTIQTTQHGSTTGTDAASRRQLKSSGKIKQSVPSDGNLRFFVVDHPTKLKDRAQLRANRKHVMKDYLDKERKNPESKDARVIGSGVARKRRRVQNVLQSDSRRPSPRTDGSHSQTESSVSPPKSEISNPSKDGSSREEWSQPKRHRADSIPPRTVRFADDLKPLVRGISGGFNNSPYLSTSLENLPSPASRIGSNLNPFDTWAKFSNSRLNVEELKWSCSRKFGSQGIAQLWVPELLKAKHAFLSTVCISSSHDDLMRRGFQAPHERTPYQSSDRMRIRGEVITMVNDAMQDPQLRTADATIVSVLHLLNSEMMGCDDTVMMIHQRGLHEMVRSRGGLDQLGVGGQLASILTITMYMISALRETEPHPDFVKYALQKRTKPPEDYRQIPESPIYCRMAGYYTLNRDVAPESPVWSLLENLRLITNSFVRGSGSTYLTPLTPVRPSTSWEQTQSSILALRDKIFAVKPAVERVDSEFSTANDKYKFEAIRLTARVYAHALANEIPFSKAAADLGGYDTYTVTPPTYPGSESDVSAGEEYRAASWHILIRDALIKTDLSDCWGHLAGVLYWLTLVAGACANPDSPHNKPRREFSPEEEEGRKWLAAIAVRCSIVLGFEYGGSILETLKRLVGIEQVLANADADKRGLPEIIPVVIGSIPLDALNMQGVIGPQDVPFVQRTFQDFAMDFLSEV